MAPGLVLAVLPAEPAAVSAGATVAVPGGDPADDVAAVPVSIAAAAPWGCGPAGVLAAVPESC